jgi:hypothetical protein
MSKEAYHYESVLTLSDGWFIRLQCVSDLYQPLGMVLTRLQKLVNHRLFGLSSSHHAKQNSHFNHYSVLVEITCTGFIVTSTHIQQPGVWYSGIPQLDNLCNCLALLIQYQTFLS